MIGSIILALDYKSNMILNIEDSNKKDSFVHLKNNVYF